MFCRAPHLRWALATVALLLSSFAVAPASGALLLEYNFQDDDDIADFVATNVNASTYNDGSGLIDVTYVDRAAARGFNPSSSAADALARGDYFEFTLSAAAGYHLDLTSLSFDERRGNTGPVTFQIEANGALLSPALTSTIFLTNHVIDLSAFTDISSINIKLLGWNASNNGPASRWFNDNVKVDGAVVLNPIAAVPEPASMAVWSGLILVGGVVRYRRRRTAAKAAA